MGGPALSGNRKADFFVYHRGSREGSALCSISSKGARDAATLEISNESESDLCLNWIRSDGECGNERSILKGKRHCECTFVGDAFLLRDVEGRRYCAFRAVVSGRHELIIGEKDESLRYFAFDKKIEEISYEQKRIAGFLCEIDTRLLLAENQGFLNFFSDDLKAAHAKLPAHCVEVLVEADTRFIVNASTRHDLTECCYHAAKGQPWLRAEGISTTFAGCIHIYCLKKYCQSRSFWGPGGCLVHELAHAYHDKVLALGHANTLICDRYAQAKSLYYQVRYKPDYHIAEHYACTNPAEFFAELSVAFLETSPDIEYNKWEPFNRVQLNRIDPKTCDLLARAWLHMDPLNSTSAYPHISPFSSIFSRCLRPRCFLRNRLRPALIPLNCFQSRRSSYDPDNAADHLALAEDYRSHAGAPPQPDQQSPDYFSLPSTMMTPHSCHRPPLSSWLFLLLGRHRNMSKKVATTPAS